jgi:hypothetical protein
MSQSFVNVLLSVINCGSFCHGETPAIWPNHSIFVETDRAPVSFCSIILRLDKVHHISRIRDDGESCYARVPIDLTCEQIKPVENRPGAKCEIISASSTAPHSQSARHMLRSRTPEVRREHISISSSLSWERCTRSARSYDRKLCSGVLIL